jgi:DNA modification methylase
VCQFSSVLRSFNGQAKTVSETGHPHTKPLELIVDLISKTDADTILDPFAGSGTTGIAAMLTGRKCILIEKDAKYCDVIRRRVREADAASPGKLFDPANDTTLFTDHN